MNKELKDPSQGVGFPQKNLTTKIDRTYTKLFMTYDQFKS